MSSPVYLKCDNCGKLNPVYGEVVPGEEHMCVFCGQLFKAPVEQESISVDEKRHGGEKKPRLKASKPENRNMRKPMV
jgi:hypothetical protein